MSLVDVLDPEPKVLPAGISMVVTAPSMKMRNLIIQIIQATSGISPNAKKDTTSAKRAMYPDGKTRTIINTSSAAMRDQLGHHVVCIVLEVDEPVTAALMAKNILKNAWINARCHMRVEPEFPEGFITFVSAPELEGIVILFWPKNPDPKVLATLDRAEPWSDAELSRME